MRHFGHPALLCLYRVLVTFLLIQANEFTLVHVNKFIPALPPCATPSDCTMAANSCGKGRCLVSVPYSFDSTPWANIPALATDRYVFWITNPSMAMYWAFNQWCRGLIGTLAFEAESSYNGITIWRMDPYEFCPVDANGERRCPEDASATFKSLPGFVSGSHSANVCNQSFLVVAPVITYVNEYNLALTVLNTTFVNVDTSTLRPIDSKLARSAKELLFFLLRVRPELTSLCVFIHTSSVEHVVFFTFHSKVREDVFVDLVEALYGIKSTGCESPNLHETRFKLLLIALMRSNDGQKLVPVCLNLGITESAFDLQCLKIRRHVTRDELALIVAEHQLLLAGESAPERAQLGCERHIVGARASGCFFFF